MNLKIKFIFLEETVTSLCFVRSTLNKFKEFQVMLDSDLAMLYNVETKQLNRAVKRNIDRFPKDFCFQLNENEFEILRCQIGTSLPKGGRTYYNYVFTEQGIAMLSGILKSKTAIQVNIQIMRTFISMRKIISENNEVFVRLNILEHKNIETETKFDKIFTLLDKSEKKKSQGIFYDSQIFDSHVFISNLIKSAKISIILIDNYIDENTLLLFNKREKGVKVIIYTKIDKNIKLDLEKYNSQYEKIEIKEFNLSHDRFLIIDKIEIYHIGASLKDLGKKWFAFSKLDKENLNILERI